MAIRFIELHPAALGDELKLNTEWVVITNDGRLPFHTRDVVMTVGKRGTAKKYTLGRIEPGFLLRPGDKVRMLTGRPGVEEHGKPPDDTDDIKNYYLLRQNVYIVEPQTVLTLMFKGMPISKAEFDPNSANGVLG